MSKYARGKLRGDQNLTIRASPLFRFRPRGLAEAPKTITSQLRADWNPICTSGPCAARVHNLPNIENGDDLPFDEASAGLTASSRSLVTNPG